MMQLRMIILQKLDITLILIWVQLEDQLVLIEITVFTAHNTIQRSQIKIIQAHTNQMIKLTSQQLMLKSPIVI